MTSARAAAPQQGGFVLAIVLVLLVVLALLAAMVASSSQRAVQETQENIDRFDGERDMVSTRETLLFMLSTQRRNLGGLMVEATPVMTSSDLDDDTDGFAELASGQEIRMDATTYAGVGQAYFAIQDDRGLLSVNWAPDVMRQAFYAAHGAASDQWDALDAKRLDYQDPDSLHRLNGAEEEQYRKAGRPPPPNRPLATPLEIRRILQWDTLLEKVDDEALLGTLSLARSSTLNLNTAPAAVLALLPGMNQEQAERLVAFRAQTPFRMVWQAQQGFPISSVMEGNLTLFSNPSGNLILWDRRFGVRRLVHWTLTPLEIGGPPWRIDYEVILSRGKQPAEGEVKTPATPLFAAPDAIGPGQQPGS